MAEANTKFLNEIPPHPALWRYWARIVLSLPMNGILAWRLLWFMYLRWK